MQGNEEADNNIYLMMESSGIQHAFHPSRTQMQSTPILKSRLLHDDIVPSLPSDWKPPIFSIEDMPASQSEASEEKEVKDAITVLVHRYYSLKTLYGGAVILAVVLAFNRFSDDGVSTFFMTSSS